MFFSLLLYTENELQKKMEWPAIEHLNGKTVIQGRTQFEKNFPPGEEEKNKPKNLDIQMRTIFKSFVNVRSL